MWNVSDEYLEALPYSARKLTKVNLYRGDTRVATDVGISEGSVKVDGNSDVRRELNMVVPDQQLLKVLDPYECDVRVWRGMLFPNGVVEWVPLGLFRVWQIDYTRPGLGITVVGKDRGAMVASAEFVTPDSSAGNADVATEIQRIIEDAGFEGLADSTGITENVGKRQVWDGTRWEAVNALSSSLDASVFFDPIGAATMTPDQPGDSVWTVKAGEGGVLIGSDVAVTRDGVFNCVVAEGEHPGSGSPIRAVKKDTDAGSPTYWNTDPAAGGFGHSVRKVSHSSWNTQDKANRAAGRLLRRSIGKVRTINLSAIPNDALEAGDVVTVRYVDGKTEELVVDGFEVPLVAGSFTVSARSKRTLTI